MVCGGAAYLEAPRRRCAVAAAGHGPRTAGPEKLAPRSVLTIVHAYQAGSDSIETYFTRGLALLVGIAVYPVSIRLIGIAQRRRALV